MNPETNNVRTWPGGPLRQMSAERFSGSIPFAREIDGMSNVGRYVCDVCRLTCGGVLLKDGRWLCDACAMGKARKGRQMTTEQRAAAGTRLALARQARQTAQDDQPTA